MPSHLVNDRYTPWIAGQNTQKPSTNKGTRTNSRSTGGNPRRRGAATVSARVGRRETSAVTSGRPDLRGGGLPGGQDRVELVGLVEELGERGVGRRLEGVAGIAVEELGEVGGLRQHGLALGDQCG